MKNKTSKVDLPVEGVDGFLAGKKNVKRTGISEIELEKNTLPGSTEIYLLNPALLK